LLKRRLANNYPALIAGGVNSSFPSATSPIAKIFEIDVYSFGSTIILPFFAIFIPIFSHPKDFVSGNLPVATRTVSYISCSRSEFYSADL